MPLKIRVPTITLPQSWLLSYSLKQAVKQLHVTMCCADLINSLQQRVASSSQTLSQWGYQLEGVLQIDHLQPQKVTQMSNSILHTQSWRRCWQNCICSRHTLTYVIALSAVFRVSLLGTCTHIDISWSTFRNRFKTIKIVSWIWQQTTPPLNPPAPIPKNISLRSRGGGEGEKEGQ